MATPPGLLPIPDAPVEPEPRPPAHRRVGPIGLRRLLAFRARVRAQLARAWSSELTQPGEDPQRCEQRLIHILQEDILNAPTLRAKDLAFFVIDESQYL